MKMKIQERNPWTHQIVIKFLAEQVEHREIYTIPSTELDNILHTFLIGVRQNNG